MLDLVRDYRHVESGKRFRGSDDKSLGYMRFQKLDGAVDEAAAGQGKKGFVAPHPLTSAAGKYKATDRLALGHGPNLHFLDGVIID